MVKEVLDTIVALAREGMTMLASPTKWASRVRSPIAWSSWIKEGIVEENNPIAFFQAPARRAHKAFLIR